MSQICPATPSDPSAEELPTNDSRYPTSILRKRPPVDQAVGEERKAERRVRFREPEVATEYAISCCDYVVGIPARPHALKGRLVTQSRTVSYGVEDHTREIPGSKTQISAKAEIVDDRSSSGLSVLLRLSFCTVLILAVILYYTSMKQDVKILEEFQSRLVIFFLQIRHIAQKCWTWFMRQ